MKSRNLAGLFKSVFSRKQKEILTAAIAVVLVLLCPVLYLISWLSLLKNVSLLQEVFGLYYPSYVIALVNL